MCNEIYKGYWDPYSSESLYSEITDVSIMLYRPIVLQLFYDSDIYSYFIRVL